MRLPLKLAAVVAAALAISTFNAQAQLFSTRTPEAQTQTQTQQAPVRTQQVPGKAQQPLTRNQQAAAQIQQANAGLCERQIQSAARKYGIPEGILYSVGLAETGRKGSLTAYALNVEGKAYFAASLAEALQLFAQAKNSGAKLIDLGCMQINHYYHGGEFASVDDMFDPAKNVEYAALFLKRLHDQHDTWTMAVARYHAGPNNNPAQREYVCRVIANLVATGFGKWTAGASSFCSGSAT